MVPMDKDGLDANAVTTLLAMLEYPCQLVMLDSVDSTNDELLRRLYDRSSSCPESTAATPLVVISARQTSGRGRLGRDWSSPPGGIYMSVLLTGGLDSASSSALSALSPLAALAVRDALQGFTDQPIQIKWPNDVLSSQGKLAGILVERRVMPPSVAGQNGRAAVIVGIGINVLPPGASSVGFEGAAYLDGLAHPDAVRPVKAEPHAAEPAVARPAADGQMTGAPHTVHIYRKQITPIAVAAATLNSLFGRYRQWRDAGYDFAPFAADYQKHQAQLGEQVWVRNAMGEVIASGEVRGVDATGRLVLYGEQGDVLVSASEVTLRN